MSGPSGIQVSYRKAVDVLAGYLRMYQQFEQPGVAQHVAETVLRGALSDRQREQERQRKDAR